MDEMNEKAKIERETEEALVKEQELAIKKEKESQRKLLKNQRKALRTICKDFKFFSTNSTEEVENMTNIEHLCEILSAQEYAPT
jgi:DnaJ family protein C protein 2